MIIAIIGVGLYTAVGDKVFAFIEKVEAFKQSLMTLKTLWILLIILSPLIIYINYRINKSIYKTYLHLKDRKCQIEDAKKEIQELLNTSLNYLNKDELKQILSDVNESLSACKETRKLKVFYKSLVQKKNDIKVALLGAEKKEILDSYESRKNKLENNIKELEKKKEEKRLELENKNFALLNNLDADINDVFVREGLSEEEIQALHEDGWEDAIEYDVIEKRNISVLVKKIMNHSKTHTFLVWSVKQLLDNFDITAEKHETKYPDITFFHNDEMWAIEVEAGSLLRKKKQMKDKVNFLNKNYPDRWMFVVTNKNLLPKYRKWGPSTPRSQVAKIVEKWLNSSI